MTLMMVIARSLVVTMTGTRMVTRRTTPSLLATTPMPRRTGPVRLPGKTTTALMARRPSISSTLLITPRSPENMRMRPLLTCSSGPTSSTTSSTTTASTRSAGISRRITSGKAASVTMLCNLTLRMVPGTTTPTS
eukprot:Rmarinus@m.17349